MLVQKEFLTKLKEFGLNTYESRLWVALLSRGVSSAGELSDIANVPRSRSYDVLDALERKGFINVKEGKPIKYVAVPPEEVLERRKQIVQDKTEEQLQLIENLSDNKILKELVALHQKGSTNISKSDLIATIKGSVNINHHLDGMIKNASSSVTIALTSTSVSKEPKFIHGLLQKAKARGVDIKIFTQRNKESEEAIKLLETVANVIHINKKARAFITDRKEVLFMLYDTNQIHENYDLAIWVKSEHLAVSLEDSFLRETAVQRKAF